MLLLLLGGYSTCRTLDSVSAAPSSESALDHHGDKKEKRELWMLI